MAIRKSKEQQFQVKGEINDVKEKCLSALELGRFKKVDKNYFNIYSIEKYKF